MTFLKQQCEENREKYPYIHGTHTASGHHHVTDIDTLTHSTALALRKELEARLPEELNENYNGHMRNAHSILRDKVLKIIRELVPDDASGSPLKIGDEIKVTSEHTSNSTTTTIRDQEDLDRYNKLKGYTIEVL